MVAISIIILIISGLLALVVLAQNPKGGGLAAGFTGAQQIGGVQRTADFLEKGTWTLAGALMVLCLVSAGMQSPGSAVEFDELDEAIEQVAPQGFDPDQGIAPEEAPTAE
ncbi:MAG: preprotein translocase subunit SecG [Flavobacteriales bacterium]|jgi:preprotein translocase subunit SecG|nr:preprotein translocase subunit SecG [Flavobacteriales bacterium]